MRIDAPLLGMQRSPNESSARLISGAIADAAIGDAAFHPSVKAGMRKSSALAWLEGARPADSGGFRGHQREQFGGLALDSSIFSGIVDLMSNGHSASSMPNLCNLDSISGLPAWRAFAAASFARALIGKNLQLALDMLRQSWALSLAINSSAADERFLDIRCRLHAENSA